MRRSYTLNSLFIYKLTYYRCMLCTALRLTSIVDRVREAPLLSVLEAICPANAFLRHYTFLIRRICMESNRKTNLD